MKEAREGHQKSNSILPAERATVTRVQVDQQGEWQPQHCIVRTGRFDSHNWRGPPALDTGFFLMPVNFMETMQIQTYRSFVRVLTLTRHLHASSLAWLVLYFLIVSSFPKFLQRDRKTIWVGRLFNIADIPKNAKEKGVSQ